MAVGITAFGIAMAVGITLSAFGDNSFFSVCSEACFPLTISLLLPLQLMWLLSQTLQREWVIQRFLEGQEQCRQVWRLLLSSGEGSRASCHGPGQSWDLDPSQS